MKGESIGHTVSGLGLEGSLLTRNEIHMLECLVCIALQPTMDWDEDVLCSD